jgi:hypothetical protein
MDLPDQQRFLQDTTPPEHARARISIPNGLKLLV